VVVIFAIVCGDLGFFGRALISVNSWIRSALIMTLEFLMVMGFIDSLWDGRAKRDRCGSGRESGGTRASFDGDFGTIEFLGFYGC
jgi:hypothetical protein